MKKPKNKSDKSYFISGLAIVISLLSLFISALSYFDTVSNRTLQYTIEFSEYSLSDDKLDFTINFKETNGAISEIKAFDYHDNTVKEISHYSYKNNNVKSLSYLFLPSYNIDNSIGTLFFLIKGKDGSEYLDMVLFHIEDRNNISVTYYTKNDLALAELDYSHSIYMIALDNYKKLYTQLELD